MARTRLILLVTIAALIAPWVAPCLLAAPTGHAAMACCRKGNDVPVARPCCGPADEEPAAPPASDTSRVQPPSATTIMAALMSPLPAASRIEPRSVLVASLPARLRSTVLLI